MPGSLTVFLPSLTLLVSLLTLLGSAGCRGDDRRGGACPRGMVLIPATHAELGEGDEARRTRYSPNTVVPRGPHDVAGYCVGEWPVGGGPGLEGPGGGGPGALWPTDGISLPMLTGTIEPLLHGAGRRLCSVEELMLAAAGPAGWRYPYGNERDEAACDAHDDAPAAMGTFPRCVSPLGAREFLVRSTWATLDVGSRSRIEAVGAGTQPGYDGVYAVYGGLVREDTYYAPTNFGVHFHESNAPAFVDDGLRVCAQPGTHTRDSEAAWGAVEKVLSETRSFASLGRLTPGR